MRLAIFTISVELDEDYTGERSKLQLTKDLQSILNELEDRLAKDFSIDNADFELEEA